MTVQCSTTIEDVLVQETEIVVTPSKDPTVQSERLIINHSELFVIPASHERAFGGVSHRVDRFFQFGVRRRLEINRETAALDFVGYQSGRKTLCHRLGSLSQSTLTDPRFHQKVEEANQLLDFLSRQ